jgi:hypothetical protein
MNLEILKAQTPCQICMKECQGKEEYWGGVGENTCSKCNRKMCHLHFNSSKKLCKDCEQNEQNKNQQ